MGGKEKKEDCTEWDGVFCADPDLLGGWEGNKKKRGGGDEKKALGTVPISKPSVLRHWEWEKNGG